MRSCMVELIHTRNIGKTHQKSEFSIFEIIRMTYLFNILSVEVIIDSALTNGILR